MDQPSQTPPASQNVVSQPNVGQSFTPPQSQRFIPWYKWVIIVVILITLSLAILYIFFRVRMGQQAPVPESQIPVGTPAANQGRTNENADGTSVLDTSTWETYEDSNIKISYPPSLTIDTDAAFKKNNPDDVAFKSQDYSVGENGSVLNGYKVVLFVKKSPDSDNPSGLISSDDTAWIGDRGKLLTVKYESIKLILKSVHKGDPYEMVLIASSENVLKASQELFFQVASTLVLK